MSRPVSSAVRPKDIIYVIIGSMLVAFSLVAFTIPNKIATGGLTGIATILYYTIGLPVGVVVLLGNLALISLQAWLIGRRSAWKTLLSIIVTSACIEVMMNIYGMPALTKDPILACLYGGIISGVGIGITFKAGGTTGGVDIISQILHFRFHFPVGDVILFSNIIVTFMAGYAFGPELALYGLITVFFSSKVIDAVLEGMSVFRSVFIISKFPDEISWAIIEDLHRGVTCINGVGVYSAKPTSILLTAVRRKEMPILRQIIYEYDPDAFVIVGDARQIIGRGFVKLGDEVRREKD
ncbi:MAG: YitT family protein [Candidatus Riflebacteria bacterium]|nr:YitT family protein [Candidatus Riflebacteria bacterium]